MRNYLLVTPESERANYQCMFSFLSVEYKNHDDLEEALLKEEIGGIFMERLQANYYYKDKTNDDNLRVFQSVHSEITYKMALRVKAMCSLLKKNSCFKRRLENPLIDSFVKKYTKPLKVYKL